MAETNKVVVNLATGLEDGERVTVAFLVGGAALEKGKQVSMFLTKEAVRLALPGVAEGVACEGCPRFPVSSSSLRPVAASSSSVRSVSIRRSSTRATSCRMHVLQGPRRSGTGSAKGP